MKNLISALTFLAFFSFSAFAGSITNWNMIYENDKDGNVLSGNLADLVAAIENGADVKVMLFKRDDASYGKHIIYPLMTGLTDNGTMPYVFWENTSFEASSIDNPFFSDTREVNIVKATGSKVWLTHSLSTGKKTSEAYTKLSMKWFVTE